MTDANSVARYAQDTAQLPLFRHTLSTALKVVETDAVPGAVLPRARNVWFALRPFYDLKRNIPNDTKRDLIKKRQAFLATLVTLATAPSSPYRWDELTMNCGESQGPEEATNRFWFVLMRLLSHEMSPYALTKCLIAVSRERQPRFLFCIDEDAGFKDFVELLEALLTPDAASIEEMNSLLSSCGVENRDSKEMMIEIGMSFASGKITHALLSKLLELADGPAKPNAGITFCVTSLRFRSDCTFQPKAMEILGQRKTIPTLECIHLGSLDNLKPVAVRNALSGILRSQARLCRLGIDFSEHFPAVASAMRRGGSSVDHLDIAYDPTTTNAAWLAFGFFHVDSNSSVTSLHLHLPPIRSGSRWLQVPMPTTEWLEVFRRSLQSTRAEGALLDTEGDADDQAQDRNSRRFVTIQTGTPAKAEPYSSGKLLYRINDETETFEVVAAVETWLAVVVAGLGVGWVPAAAVLTEEPVPSRLADAENAVQTNRKITSLVWDGTADAVVHERLIATVVELLSIIGEPLERLHLPMAYLSTPSCLKSSRRVRTSPNST